ncbi:MAG: 50S ribosomal protein L17, partial [Alphaproteobacteria bacterium]|nr:50S ribosomal protein L17 [Alphaproteobacteria bacterium]
RRRQAISYLGDKDLAAKILGPLAERYKDRQGGYVRIIKAGFRQGDNSAMAVIELVDRDLAAKGQDSGPTAEKKADEAEASNE